MKIESYSDSIDKNVTGGKLPKYRKLLAEKPGKIFLVIFILLFILSSCGQSPGLHIISIQPRINSPKMGETNTYLIRYKNTTDNDFNNIILTIQYDTDLILTSPLTQTNVITSGINGNQFRLNLGTLRSNEEGSLSLEYWVKPNISQTKCTLKFLAIIDGTDQNGKPDDDSESQDLFIDNHCPTPTPIPTSPTRISTLNSPTSADVSSLKPTSTSIRTSISTPASTSTSTPTLFAIPKATSVLQTPTSYPILILPSTWMTGKQIDLTYLFLAVFVIVLITAYITLLLAKRTNSSFYVSKRSLRENHKRRLSHLENIASIYGNSVDPHITMEIEDIKAKLKEE